MESNKENQDHELAAGSVSVASPRISSVGAPSEDAGRPSQPYSSGHQLYELTTGLDHLHWGGVGHRVAHDARSVASSAAAERDDKSIYDLEPGALDATEGEARGLDSKFCAACAHPQHPRPRLQSARSGTTRMRSPWRRLPCRRCTAAARRRQ